MDGLFITGTDTGVGKTWIGCRIARRLSQQGLRVVPRKPVESGCTPEDDQLIPEDALALMTAADYSGRLEQVCPWRFEAAISPQRAAKLLNQPLTTEQLIAACLNQLDRERDFLLVEGAGGFYSPLCEDGLNADLAQALALPLLLVAEDRLGCINQVLLTTEAIAARRMPLLAVVLNSARPGTADGMNNLDDLRQLLDCPVIPVDRQQQELPDSLIGLLLKQDAVAQKPEA
jgi:dethiobiotin synthetase